MERMNDALMRHLPPDVHWTLPDGGYFVWLEFPDAIDAMGLHREAIRRGVSVAPGPLFSAAHAFERCVRINFGHPWSAAVDDAIRTVGELVAQPSVRKRR